MVDKGQDDIAKLLETVNNKMLINNKINDNLEQQTKLLYDYWFTQFDFPNEEGKPYRTSGGKMIWNEVLKREIPADWSVVPFLDIVSWESNSQPPKSEFVYEPKEGYVRFIQNRDYDSDEYTSFAESDSGRIGFLADGQTPLLIYQDGRIIPFIFPKDTIVLDKFLLAEREQGRRRFTMAHEASHHILERMNNDTNAARFHTEFDNERVYTQNELAQMFASVEWQADTMGASLLMPKFIVENALAKFTNSKPIKIYGDTTFAKRDKEIIRKMAAYLGVSYTALVIRLRGLDMLEYHDISEYISNELQLGGVQ